MNILITNIIPSFLSGCLAAALIMACLYFALRCFAVVRHIAKKQKAFKKLMYELAILDAKDVNTSQIRLAIKDLV